MNKVRTVVACAGRNQQLGHRYGNPGEACAPREIIGGIPDLCIDRQFRQGMLEIPQDLPVMLAVRPLPQLKAHHRTPAGIA